MTKLYVTVIAPNPVLAECEANYRVDRAWLDFWLRFEAELDE